jgi:hypothetical protein
VDHQIPGSPEGSIHRPPAHSPATVVTKRSENSGIQSSRRFRNAGLAGATRGPAVTPPFTVPLR